LTSTLPAKYRIPSIISPPKIPTAEEESIYVGLYTFIIATIYLGGGSLSEAKLDRYLKRTNADQSTPIDRTDKLLQRMIKDGYIFKIKDSSSGEEMVEYIVGPRGKTEVGEEGVAQFVKTVYGESDVEDLDRRLEWSIGLAQRPAEPKANTSGPAKGRKRKSRLQSRDDEEEEEQDDDD
jgi:melanoma-associated antigen